MLFKLNNFLQHTIISIQLFIQISSVPAIPSDSIDTLLRRNGVMTATQMGSALGISQPSVSRLLAASGPRIVRIGRARASRYALARDIGRMGNAWPVHRIDGQGRASTIGTLQAIHGGGFVLSPAHPVPGLMHDFANGLFPDLPWFLDDQRPQGFLGRAFARRIAADIGAPHDLVRWQTDDVILALLRHGDDSPGDLVLGDDGLQRALRQIVQPAGTIALDERRIVFPQRAEAALRGEDAGSSAGGEQPKFTATVEQGDARLPVIVKFSDRAGSAAARRWADLLRCERHAADILRRHGFAAAEYDIVEADERTFLQSTRFDRTPRLGRRGFVSLAALDAAFYGHARIDWPAFAGHLERDGWIEADAARALRTIGWFGALIANTDMHLGNAGLVLADTRPLELAPVYDMLPMAFRPATSGEVVTRACDTPLPTPDAHGDWRQAAVMALLFWQAAAADRDISGDFRAIAMEAAHTLQHAMAHVG